MALYPINMPCEAVLHSRVGAQPHHKDQTSLEMFNVEKHASLFYTFQVFVIF
jgi:hypothetical protein